MKIAVSGASGKTGYRIAEEGLKKGNELRLLTRKESVIPDSLSKCERFIISLQNQKSIDNALSDCDALIIATGARPSIDLTGPARIDACGVRTQIKCAVRAGVKRIILVSSLCTGQIFHPLNLFGLILIWKRVGEKALESSGQDWTIIRPGGLNEREEDIKDQNVRYSGPDQQKDAYIPRRLVAKCCIEALETPSSKKQIIEVTSSSDIAAITMKEALEKF